ncbi:MAG: adenosylhomocysteinase [Caldisericia bacterium]|nr:adenosylhomocysteinase [Caldisericia bacterium]MDD4614298.1 adenosylhomocysteinase [Caldisericia bacterium]
MKTSGEKKIEWVRNHMPLLSMLEDQFVTTTPFKNITIAICIHLEAKTARLAEVLAKGGATVLLSSSNTLSTQDDVAAAIAEHGVQVFAKHGCSDAEYYSFLRQILQKKPALILDDGGDLTHLLHEEYSHQISSMLGGCEETTTGVIRLQSRNRQNQLRLPMILVNNAHSKYLFDNRYGTGQSVWTSIMNVTNLIVAGKKVVVAGYGWCGKGVASRAKALGASVIVTEVNPIKAMEAHMDGFQVMTMEKAAPLGDIFITVTGCKEVVSSRHFNGIKNNAILCNAGHFNVEIDMKALEDITIHKNCVRDHISQHILSNGNKIHVLAEGKLVNLASGDGHPAEIMDLSFALQALSALYLIEHPLRVGLYPVPTAIDEKVASLKLQSLGLCIDQLTPSQKEYIESSAID